MNKFLKSKYAILLPVILVILIAGIIAGYMLFGRRMTPQKLLQINFGEQSALASDQTLKVNIKNRDSDMNLSLSMKNERDSDTDHITAKNALPKKYGYEMYITKVDLKYAVYHKLDSNYMWTVRYKKKNISEDDVRTAFVEANNELNLTDVKIDAFSNIEFDDTSDAEYYIVKGKTNYNTVLAIIGNMRYTLTFNDTYAELSNFFTKSAADLMVDITFKFKKTDNSLSNAVFESDAESLKKCLNDYKKENEVEDIHIKSFEYELTNEGYEKKDVYVPDEVDLNSINMNENKNKSDKSDSRTVSPTVSPTANSMVSPAVSPTASPATASTIPAATTPSTSNRSDKPADR